MTIRITNLRPVHCALARSGLIRSAIALAAAAAALVTTGSGAGAGAPEIGGGWSSGFNDWLWTDTVLTRPKTLSPPLQWTDRCLVDCVPALGTYVVRWTELMSSNAPDVSVLSTQPGT
jgi:hypothetical protein